MNGHERRLIRRDRSAVREEIVAFRYELTNLTAAGGSVEYPIASEVTFRDVRVRHALTDGTSREVPLFDFNGVRQVNLACNGVFLHSDAIAGQEWKRLASIRISGVIQPGCLVIKESERSPAISVCVFPEFVFETNQPLPHLYEALYVTDKSGKRYAIGTIGISSVEVGERFELLPERACLCIDERTERRSGGRRRIGGKTHQEWR